MSWYRITSTAILTLIALNVPVILGIRFYDAFPDALFVAGWCLMIVTGYSLIAYVHLLVLGAIFIRWNFYLTAFHHGSRAAKNIALTFDDGPAGYTNVILDILKQESVPAAFFCIGKNVAENPQAISRAVSEGHIVGNHSYHHGFLFDLKGSKNMLQEMEETNTAIQDACGQKPCFFRPPYGVTNPNLAKAVRLSGMVAVGWSLRSFDTAAKSESALLAKLIRKASGGDIILLHDSMAHTASILTAFIKAARSKGFTFVSLDKLIDRDAFS